MSQQDKATRFRDLHINGTPVILYNAWDAGSATAIAAAGAPAIATSSWAVAEAHGYRDGEDIPLELANQIIARIAASVDIPVSADFEGGYTDNDDELATNITRLLEYGIVGINFEDRRVNGTGLYDIDRQSARITAIRTAADRAGVDLFVNARTDLFLGQGNDPVATIGQALERAHAYAAAGASGYFIPGLTEADLIARIVDEAPLPINVMVMGGLPSNDRLAQIGVARISYGAGPYIAAVDAIGKEAVNVYS